MFRVLILLLVFASAPLHAQSVGGGGGKKHLPGTEKGLHRQYRTLKTLVEALNPQVELAWKKCFQEETSVNGVSDLYLKLNAKAVMKVMDSHSNGVECGPGLSSVKLKCLFSEPDFRKKLSEVIHSAAFIEYMDRMENTRSKDAFKIYRYFDQMLKQR